MAEQADSISRLYARVRQLGLALVLGGLAAVLWEQGLLLPAPAGLGQAANWLLGAAVLAHPLEVVLALVALYPWEGRRRLLLADAVLAILAMVLLVGARHPGAAFAVVAVRQILIGAARAAGSAVFRPWLRALEARPLRLVALSFLLLIAVGTALLLLPAASASGRSVPAVDALFTATSAACVTGLIVRSTPHDWSLFGQTVILGLIQVGGLGIMALSVSVIMLLGHRLRVRQQAALFQTMDVSTAGNLRASLRYLLLLTVAFEAVGCGLLTLRFALDTDGWGRAAWLGLFHSVSAWNNAGFALWDDSLSGYRSDLMVNATVMLLVFAGGLGFAVLGQVLDPGLRRNWREVPRVWSTHTKLVLITSAALLAIGALSIFFVEFDRGLVDLPPGEKLLAAFFHSVSARTAGFNTVNLAECSSLGLFLVSVLMFIGGSPGSTAGGIKTSTVAVLLLAIRSLSLNRDELEVFGRRIPRNIILRVMGIVVISAFLIAFFFTLLLLAEPGHPFEWLLFETVSAFGTVGLSTGITPALGAPARLLLTALMFVGRVGPLTLALALSRRTRRLAISYPEGQVAVG